MGTRFTHVRNVFFDIVRVLACVEVRKAQVGPGSIVRRVERIKAARGTTLRCKGWRQEAILRMLENNLENAEKPDELIIYGGAGDGRPHWGALAPVGPSPPRLRDDHSLLLPIGQTGAAFTTPPCPPPVLPALTRPLPQTMA